VLFSFPKKLILYPLTSLYPSIAALSIPKANLPILQNIPPIPHQTVTIVIRFQEEIIAVIDSLYSVVVDIMDTKFSIVTLLTFIGTAMAALLPSADILRHYPDQYVSLQQVRALEGLFHEFTIPDIEEAVHTIVPPVDMNVVHNDQYGFLPGYFRARYLPTDALSLDDYDVSEHKDKYFDFNAQGTSLFSLLTCLKYTGGILLSPDAQFRKGVPVPSYTRGAYNDQLALENYGFPFTTYYSRWHATNQVRGNEPSHFDTTLRSATWDLEFSREQLKKYSDELEHKPDNQRGSDLVTIEFFEQKVREAQVMLKYWEFLQGNELQSELYELLSKIPVIIFGDDKTSEYLRGLRNSKKAKIYWDAEELIPRFVVTDQRYLKLVEAVIRKHGQGRILPIYSDEVLIKIDGCKTFLERQKLLSDLAGVSEEDFKTTMVSKGYRV